MSLRRAYVFLAAALAAAFGGAVQADPLQVERGRKLAVDWCSSCHVVSSGQTTAMSDAPSFRQLAAQGTLDAGGLAIALFRPHPVMPSLDLARNEVAALAAYLQVLAEEAEADQPRRTGRSLAVASCAGCHAIAGPGPSPEAAAPPFSTLAARYPIEALGEALAEGIVVGHHGGVEMPEFAFDADDVGALLAYLESVQS